MLRAYVQSFLQTLICVCLLVRFPSFRYPQINVYINKYWEWPPPQRRERSERAKNLDFVSLYVTFAVVLDENWIF